MATPDYELTVPFLRSCKQEISTPVSSEITGIIPEWLQGNLLRIGSGLLDIGPDHYEHAFDGLALIRKFSITNGNITYQNRFLRSDTYRKNIKENRIAVSEFGTNNSPDPCKTIFQKLSSVFTLEEFSDNDLVNIVKYTDEYYACSETNCIWKINPENLESEQKVDLQKHVPIMTGTAHPHEGENGSVFNVGSSVGCKPAYTIIEFPVRVDGQQSVFDGGKVIGRIPMSRRFAPSYYHSFGMTENYFVFIEQPLFLSVPKLIFRQFSSNTTVADCLKWQPMYKNKIHVMRRKDGTVVDLKYVADAFAVFHHINTYEEDDHIIMDICSYKSGDIVKSMYVKALKNFATSSDETASVGFESEPKRYVLPLNVEKKVNENSVRLQNSLATAMYRKDGTVHCQPESLCEPGWFTELPRINYEKFNGRKYRYFYAMAGKKDTKQRYVVKVDLQERTILHWNEENAIPSEPVFVSYPENGGKEDKGVLLVSILFNDDDKKVALLILNAESMKEIGRATFSVQSSVPGDFHGIFIPSTL